MKELFGLSMNYIAAGSVTLAALILLLVAVIAVRNPVMFKMGIRNIPRRPAQTTLIVIGLMLSTVIMTAAFGTGDTVASSVDAEVYSILGQADESIAYNTEQFPAPDRAQVIPGATVQQWRRQFAADPDIEAFLPLNTEVLPVQNTRSRLNEAAARIVGWRATDAEAFGGLKDTSGKDVRLGPGQIAVNRELVNAIDAKLGDRLLLFFEGRPVEVTVAAIVPNTLLGGTFNTVDRQGAALDFDFLASVTGRGDNADVVFVSNTGDARSGVARTDRVTAKLKAATAGTPFQVTPDKQDGIQHAQLIGSFFTTFFVIFGLFGIAAGVLLIFLIFVMLAAERRPEMGMARAVGAKRRQIVESFLAEGLGYDLGSAVVGLVVGVGVVFAMVGFISSTQGDSLGLILAVNVTPRSLLVAFCLGVIATFIVIFFASYRASRVNIVAAIRDLPESRPINPESATLLGYLRGTLNGFVAFGIVLVSFLLALRLPAAAPLFLLAGGLGLVGPWIYVIRGSDFGAPAAERHQGAKPPTWPWILGAALIVVGWVLVVVPYALAVLVTRSTRDRKPGGVPPWLLLVGILFAPVGVVLAALQDRRRAIAWSVGFGTVGLVTAVILIQWGLASNRVAPFAFGVSLVLLWAALSLRYFRMAERLSFTACSAALLAFWYTAPSGRLAWLLGDLNGGFEMFFLSGMAMVTAGTFIVVYNADLVLPLIGAFGARFGRIFPAVKTAVAYPLTSRFRTGMTVAMIGLIMFSLVMFQTINVNFSRVFLGEGARGGFDVQAVINPNNRLGDASIDPALALRQRLEEAGVDTSRIARIAETRVAFPFEVEVKDPNPRPGSDGKLDEYGSFTVRGVDAAFLETNRIEFQQRARGYPTDATVRAALAADPNLAVVPTSLFGVDGFDGPAADAVDFGTVPVDGFEPFPLTFRDPSSGVQTTVTVIGVMNANAESFFPGIMVQRGTLLRAFPESEGQTFFLTLKNRADSEQVAKDIESTLVQASSDSLERLLDQQQRQQQGFLYLFQGFMGLGLLVGIAALGVIASRAVVERRQQIGMLRAIGYQRSMIWLSFLFESSFISLAGIGLGFALALSLSWVLFTSGGIDESAGNVAFIVPWLPLIVIAGIAFGASMLMTFLPARAASRVPVAEALRYE